MKYLLTFLLCISSQLLAAEGFYLSKAVYDPVPFSDQYADSGALIRNVNIEPLKSIKLQIEGREGVKLEDRGEAHITVITPPESQGAGDDPEGGIGQFITMTELIDRYASSIMDTEFEVVCVGRQKREGAVVYYLVVDSPSIIGVRQHIGREMKALAGVATEGLKFEPRLGFYPHITIGYLGSDVHGVSKGRETCIGNVEWDEVL